MSAPLEAVTPRGTKVDTRPAAGGWAPGHYMCQCRSCQDMFMGDKRATCCADCAYKYSMEEVVKRAAKLRGELPSLIQPNTSDHDTVALLSEVERLNEELNASRELIAKLEASLAGSASAELRWTLGARCLTGESGLAVKAHFCLQTWVYSAR